MAHRIVIAGAGHGGLVAGMHLADAGHEVLVYERQAREDLGWDWHDHVPLGAFERAGLPLPQPGIYYRRANLTFISPDLSTVLKTNVPEEDREIGIERKDLASSLVVRAKDAGVTFEFERKVDGPLVVDDLVTGIISNGEKIEADLVIDAAGLHSPVRKGLPISYGIQRTLSDGDTFHAYRAYHELLDGQAGEPSFITHFGFQRTRGIAWFQDHDLPKACDRTGAPFADILVGKIGPFAAGEVDALVAGLKELYPRIGDRILRGGFVTKIPVRRTLDKITGDRYAVIGDAACMAKPINGSGVEHSMVAGKILARVVCEANKAGKSKDATAFSQSRLWPFQHEYMLQFGARMAGVALVKDYLASAPWPHIDFIFKRRIIKSSDIEGTTRGGELSVSGWDLLCRAARGITKPRVLLGVKKLVDSAAKATRVAGSLPQDWNLEAFNAWQSRMKEI